MIFQNYHRHSEYTNPRISDSTVSNKDYALRAKELGHSVISTMEHGWQGRYIEGYRLAKELNLKFLFGTEAYWVKDRFEKDRTNSHIYIGAKNEKGRRAINDVLAEANITGFYGQPRLDIPLILSLPRDDVWVTTACIAYWRYEDIEEITKQFAEHFRENFFLEVQYHNTESQIELNQRIMQLKDKLKIPIIMGCDSHYINEKDSQIRDDFLLSKGLKYEDEQGWFLDYPDGKTAYKRFVKQGVLNGSEIEEAMNNTNTFLAVEEYDSPIFNDEIKMPSLFPEKSQEFKDDYLRKVVYSGWAEYKQEISEKEHKTYEAEIESELSTIFDTKMTDYFIDNYHIIKRGKENGGVLTSSGRGSAVSFFVNKLLGFTEVDRIKASVKMYPERFMSTERILQSGSLPDIDFNTGNVEPFALAQKQVLGEEHAYPMIAYGTYKTSSAWKLYAKSQGVPFEIANEVSQQIKKYENAYKHADEEEKENINVYDYIQREYREVFKDSSSYLNLITSWSIAPCSYLLYQGNIRQEIGLIRTKDTICCVMDGHWAEEGHFLKNDLLTVKVVDLISKIFERVKIKPFNVNELLEKIKDDEAVWDIYKKGCTIGVNQVEQTGTSARVRTYSPKNISELCAFIAAIRPGFASMYKTFESRKPFKYGVDAFDKLIQTEEMPNSFVLYQEQEMAALNFAGISMGDTYTAVKNIAKKRAEKVLAYKDMFLKGFSESIIKQGKSKEEAEKLSQNLWQIIEDSANYLFNASHAYCMAIDSLYCAYLKAHYPLEFYEVILKQMAEKGDKDKMLLLKNEAENYFGITFPPFRFGQDNREIKANKDTNQIVNSLVSIKGFSKTLCALLYQCSQIFPPKNREKCGETHTKSGENHTTFVEVLNWLYTHSCKSSKILPLIKIGYFSDFGTERELIKIVEIYEFLKQGTAKELNKNKIPNEYLQTIKRSCTDIGANGNTLKSYQIEDCKKLLYEIIDDVCSEDMPNYSYKEIATMQTEIMGYFDLTTSREEDRKKLFILDVFPLEDRYKGGIWKYKVNCKSIGSGKTASLSINPDLYKRNQFNKGDIINVEIAKDKKGYWNIYEVKKMQEDSL